MKPNNDLLTPFVSVDFDECYSNSSNCDVNAACTNTLFSFVCTCKQGFIGNGTTCEGALRLYLILGINFLMVYFRL